jgi:predicted membrane protein
VQDNFDDEHWDESPDALPRTERRRLRRQCRQASAPRLFFAILLISAGTLLFLSNLGLLPAFNFWSFWPAIFILGGVGKLTTDHRRSGQAFGIILIAFGSLFLLINLGILHVRTHDDSWPLSLVLMAVGAVALVKILEANDRVRPRVGFPIGRGSLSADLLREQVIFGSLKRKIESTNFQGGKLDSIFGSIDLDFRRAQISSPERSATLETNAVFGSIELRVPETWRVVAQATGIFGSVEDKTVANKLPGFDGPTLYITGAAVFGAVEIKD